MGIGPHDEAVPLALPGVSGEITGSHGGSYLGYTIRETAGSTAHVILYDNASAASGPILEEIGLVANATSTANYLRPGRYVGNGIYAAVTGAIEGSVFQ